MSIRSLSLLVSVVVVVGCDSAPMTGPDASVSPDAGRADGGPRIDDAGAGSDAGASSSDAGVSPYCQYEACDPRYPDGCGDGSCVLWAQASSCESTFGSLSAGMACESVMDCAPGFACFLTPDGGVCGRVCCPADPSACTGGAVCAGAGVLVDGSQTTWGRCMPPRSCDVLHPETTCEAREGCYIVGADGSTECRVAGSGGPGAACAVQEDCQSGFFCGGIGDNLRCVRICRIGAGDCPVEEGRCIAQAHSPDGTGFCTLDASTAR